MEPQLDLALQARHWVRRDKPGPHRLMCAMADEIERLRLTDAEREAIGVAIQCVEAAMAQRHPEEEDARDLLHKTSTTLSRLFDRCAIGHQEGRE